MNRFSEYSKPTVEMLFNILEEANKDEYIMDIFLHRISEEVIENFIKELKKIAKSKKVDFNTKVNLLEHPDIYKLVKEVEKKEWEHIMSYAWYAMQVFEESLVRSYRNTYVRTEILFSPAIYGTSPTLGTKDFTANVQITDTYITSHYLKIPWCQDGKTYSDRLYGHVSQFQNKLNYVLEQGINQGKGFDWMCQAWRKLTGSTAYATARLLKTETVAMWSQATKNAYLEMGIEYVEIIGDAVCGGICLDYVGTAIPLREAELGDELPPYHPNCACSFVAYEEQVNVDETSIDDYEE